MKQEFSTKWIASRQPRKQRKYIFNAPLHARHRFLSTHLSKDLHKKYSRRSIILRKRDEVLVMRGPFARQKAHVLSVDTKRTRVILDNITRKKKDGTKLSVFFHPSNLQIISLNLDDKHRLRKLKIQQEEKNVPHKGTNK